MTKKPTINIAHVYAREMNIYGDNGNVLTLKRRLEWRGFNIRLEQLNVGDSKKLAGFDIVIGGGGQDSGQEVVQDDLVRYAPEFRSAHTDGVVMLMICGMYQLFGEYFLTADGKKISGVNIFDLVTIGGPTRMIGNISVDSDFGRLVGFENHSGETTLGKGQLALGTITKGNGNNSKTNDEGAQSVNTFGTYMHGPLLPKNPQFADELIGRALARKGYQEKLELLEDELEHSANEHASSLQY